MRAYALVLGAVVPLALLGCAGAETETDDQESVQTAEQPIIVDPPTPTGFLFIRLLVPVFRVPAVQASKLPTATAALGLADSTGGDDGGDDDDGGDPK